MRKAGVYKSDEGATYLGASVRKMGEREMIIRQGRYRLHVRFCKNGGSLLNATESGQMTRRVREDIVCHVEYTLMMYGDRVLMHTVTGSAAAEYDTKEEKNENSSYHGRKDKRKIFKRSHRRIQQAAEPLL